VNHQFFGRSLVLCKIILFGTCITFPFSVFAQESVLEAQRQWARSILVEVSNLPGLKAAESELSVSGFLTQAAGRPLYNPEISADYADKPGREFGVSINQTLDVSGKRTTRAIAAQSSLVAAQHQLSSIRNSAFSSALHALSQYALASRSVDLFGQQVTLLEQLLGVTENRLAAGDLGALDVEFVRLSLSEALYEAARASSELRIAQGLVEAEAGITRITPVPEFSLAEPPVADALEQLVEDIPVVQAAQYQYVAARDAVDVAAAYRRADPTVGLGTGKDGDDSVVALSLSIPLNIRNRYTAEVDAAREESIAAELRYINTRRVKLTELIAASESFRQLDREWLQWQGVTTQGLDQSRDLLTRLWESGDITTADYVFGLQQQVRATRAGAEFEQDVFRAWIDWLEASGQTEQWLESISQQPAAQ